MTTRTQLLPFVGMIAVPLTLAACGSGSEAPLPAVTKESAASTAAPIKIATAETAPPTKAGPAEAAMPAKSHTASKTIVESATKASKDIPVRGKNGLEGKCIIRVGVETGTRVLGTSRIDELQNKVDVYVNIEGGQAPWRCRIYRDGRVEGIMYTGDEGAL
jgi:hypothetical protein